jgi:hypothetical protein
VIRAHSDAVVELLDGLEVYLTYAEGDPEFPYVVLHPDQGLASSTSYSGGSDWRPWRYQTTCVGETAEQAQVAVELVEARLLDARPTVPGRSCTPIRKEVTLAIARDETVSPPVFIARDTWVFSSIPA